MDQQELDIILLCKKGESENFGLLYDKYIEKIYKFIYYKTHHKETTEDLTSKTFMKAFEKIDTFADLKGSFAAWLYKIARNTVIDHYRAKKIDTNIEDVWDLKDDKDINKDIDIKQQLNDVDKYLKNLKPEQREIIIMRVWENLSYQEIAEILEKSEASCKMTFSRAINKLRKEMPLAIFIALILASR